MLDKDLIHRVMECDQKSKDEEDEICRMALEGAAAIASIRDVAREEGEVAAVSEFCDGCCFLRLLHDPNPYDWFEDNEMMAVCCAKKAVIEGAMGPFETNKIQKPLYCPKIGRKLTNEEEEKAKTWLKWGQERWIKEVKKV